MSSRKQKRIRERGSALLIVFVFAAIMAIMLYREMPVAAFEAQRQKEELLVDRGNEYKHAVKLFVRKLGTYPASMEALESTNRMRFLRHRFVDPFTGKDDWRLLHAGPGGMIVDSKVNPNPNGVNGAPAGTNNGSSASAFNNGSTLNGGSGFASGSTVPGNSTSSSNRTSSSASSGGFAGFANSFSGGSSNGTANSGEVTVAAIPQRRPAVAVTGGGLAGSGNNEESVPLDDSIPPVPTESQPVPSQLLPVQVAGEPNNSAQTTLVQSQNGMGTAYVPAGSVGTATASASPNSNDPQAVLRSLLSNGPNPVAQQNTAAAPNTTAAQNTPGQTGSAFGQTTNKSAFSNNLSSGGIAGVASKAKGHTIKLINDQSDYSLWEFYYDLAKEANAGLANALQQQGNGNRPGVTNGGNAPGNGSSSGFSLSSGQSSGFGSASGFGSSPNVTNVIPATPAGSTPPGSLPASVEPPQP